MIWKELILVVASYLGVFVLAIIIINWLLGGLFKPYIRVRGSRGRFVLVKVKNIVSDYYRVGQVDEKFLVFKDRKKQERRLALPIGAIYRSLNVSIIDVDDEKNTVINYNSDHVIGFDANKFSSLYERALMKPALVNRMDIIIIVLLVVVLVAVGVSIYYSYQNQELLKTLSQITRGTIEQVL
jgi:hypothetical protein